MLHKVVRVFKHAGATMNPGDIVDFDNNTSAQLRRFGLVASTTATAPTRGSIISRPVTIETATVGSSETATTKKKRGRKTV